LKISVAFPPMLFFKKNQNHKQNNTHLYLTRHYPTITRVADCISLSGIWLSRLLHLHITQEVCTSSSVILQL
jgi:hypothetical protein